MKSHHYFVYITTNKIKTVLYIGVTNNITYRLSQHQQDAIGEQKHFTGKYNCTHLVYYEYFQNIHHAIDREKQLKKWVRQKKEQLIKSFNPEWKFLNDKLG